MAYYKRLNFNTNKSVYKIFGNPNKSIPVLQLRINNANIDEIQNLNFLGLQVSSDITWNLHRNKTFKKLSRIIGSLTDYLATNYIAEECTFDYLLYTT